MKKFLLGFFKNLIPGIVDAALLEASASIEKEIGESTNMKPIEKEAALVGIKLLVSRLKEELDKKLNG